MALADASIEIFLAIGVPEVSRFEPNPTNASENKQTQFECYGHGLPLPTFTITKVVPTPGRFGKFVLKQPNLII